MYNSVNNDGNDSSFATRGFLRSLNTNMVTVTASEVPGAQGRQFERRLREFYGKS